MVIVNRLSLKNRDFLCWLAGFYEGEGSCGTYLKRQKYVTIQVSITQKEKAVLLYIKNRLGFGSISRDKRKIHTYSVTGQKALDFLELVLPHMQSKYKIVQATTTILSYYGKEMPDRQDYPKKSVASLFRKRNEKGCFVKK